MKKGIKSLGAYLPYHYLTRAALGAAWGGKGGKGEKSVADVDEDSVTMAVEAAMGCFRFTKREDVNALYFASTTGPYAEKCHAALIAVACDLKDENVFTSDIMTSTRAGTNALKSALDSVVANPGQSVLVTAADARNGYPKSAQETGFGDGAAAFIVGTGDDLIAEVDHFTSVSEEINDYWRNAGDKYTLHAEGRFCDEEGYLREMKIVLKKFESETGTKAADYDKVVLVAQNAKLQTKIATKFGIDPERLSDTQRGRHRCGAGAARPCQRAGKRQGRRQNPGCRLRQWRERVLADGDGEHRKDQREETDRPLSGKARGDRLLRPFPLLA